MPGTWLEADPAGRLRDQRNQKWFGEVIYQSDFPYLLAGLLPVWSPQVVNPTPTPETYFLFRSRDDPNRDWRRTGPVKEPPPSLPVDPNDLFTDLLLGSHGHAA